MLLKLAVLSLASVAVHTAPVDRQMLAIKENEVMTIQFVDGEIVVDKQEKVTEEKNAEIEDEAAERSDEQAPEEVDEAKETSDLPPPVFVYHAFYNLSKLQAELSVDDETSSLVPTTVTDLPVSAVETVKRETGAEASTEIPEVEEQQSAKVVREATDDNSEEITDDTEEASTEEEQEPVEETTPHVKVLREAIEGESAKTTLAPVEDTTEASIGEFKEDAAESVEEPREFSEDDIVEQGPDDDQAAITESETVEISAEEKIADNAMPLNEAHEAPTKRVMEQNLCLGHEEAPMSDGFHRFKDSCTEFFECKDGKQMLEVMSCSLGQMFALGSPIIKNGDKYQPGACVVQTAAMKCTI